MSILLVNLVMKITFKFFIEVLFLSIIVLIFVFYLLLVFTFYIFTSTIVKGDRTYRRVRYNDPAVDNLLEIVSNER